MAAIDARGDLGALADVDRAGAAHPQDPTADQEVVARVGQLRADVSTMDRAAANVDDTRWAVAAALSSALAALLILVGLASRRGAGSRGASDRAQRDDMLAHANDPYFEIDLTGRLLAWSGEAERMFGWHSADVCGYHVEHFLLPERELTAHAASLARLRWGDWESNSERRERMILDASGAERCVEITCWPSRVRGSVTICGFLRDISGRRRLESELRTAAETDALTGLANRGVFQRRLSELAEGPVQRVGALIFLDLDDFKTVNDTYGHRLGDQLLQATAARISQSVAPFDEALAARFGGDEFAILIPGLGAAEARWLAASLVARLRQSYVADDLEMLTSSSLGLVLLGQHGVRAEEALRDADLAMYAAKSRGRNTWAEFEDSMYESMSADTRMEAELRAALHAGKVEVHYQPVISLGDGCPHSVEALARWNHPELGSVPPDRFIPLAERRNLIVAVGEYVLREVCRQLAEWRLRYGQAAPHTAAVNVSVEQLRDPAFSQLVRDVLERNGLFPADIVLEVTESVAMRDETVVIDNLNRIHALGIRLSIDDFGTGHSSLSRLRELPISTLKVDRSFLARIDEDGADPLVHAIVTMARSLELDVVVEGIEKLAEAEYVTWLGCRYGQGFLYSKARTASELMTWWQESTGSHPVPVPRGPHDLQYTRR